MERVEDLVDRELGVVEHDGVRRVGGRSGLHGGRALDREGAPALAAAFEPAAEVLVGLVAAPALRTLELELAHAHPAYPNPSNISRNSVAAFEGEQFLLPFRPPAVADEVAAGSDRAVARDEERDGVRGAGAADGPRRTRTSDPPRDLAIGSGRAGRDRPKLFPDAGLEGGRARVQGQRRVDRLSPEDPTELAPRAAKKRG